MSTMSRAALYKELTSCRAHLRNVVRAYFSDTGAEPPHLIVNTQCVSILGRAVDEAKDYLSTTIPNVDHSTVMYEIGCECGESLPNGVTGEFACVCGKRYILGVIVD